MSLVNDGSGNMVMPVSPMGAGGYGNSIGWGGDGSFWIIILFLFAMFGGNWGGAWGNGGGMMPYMMNNNTNADVQRGFDQQSVMNGINGITGAVSNGFANVQNSLCSGFAGVNASIANGFAQNEIADNARQIANMNQMFALQSGLSNQFNTIAMNQQNAAYENRAAVADLKYTVANEACSDRAAIESALRDVTAQGVANTTALLNTINGGIQSLKDQYCQDKIDAKNERIQELQQQLYMKDLAASQANQNALIQQGFSNEVDALYNRLNTCPVPTTPVYGRTPIFTCNGNGGAGCGCNGGF